MAKTEIDLRKLYVYLLRSLLSPLTDCNARIVTVFAKEGKQPIALSVAMSPEEIFGVATYDDLIYCDRYREIMGLTMLNRSYITENTQESYPLFVECRYYHNPDRLVFVLSERACREELLMAMLKML